MINLSSIKGIAYKFGDDVNTDAIIPSKHLDNPDPLYLAKFVMSGIDPDFRKKVKIIQKLGEENYNRPDLPIIIVAGYNFGSGSSREQAADALKHGGVISVVAESFNAIFFRNAINVGLALIAIPNVHDMIEHTSIIELNFRNGIINFLQPKKESIKFHPLEKFILKRLEHGGLIPELREMVNSNKNQS